MELVQIAEAACILFQSAARKYCLRKKRRKVKMCNIHAHLILNTCCLVWFKVQYARLEYDSRTSALDKSRNMTASLFVQ